VNQGAVDGVKGGQGEEGCVGRGRARSEGKSPGRLKEGGVEAKGKGLGDLRHRLTGRSKVGFKSVDFGAVPVDISFFFHVSGSV